MKFVARLSKRRKKGREGCAKRWETGWEKMMLDSKELLFIIF